MLMAAMGIGLALGLKFGAMASALKDYSPPPHRCEWVRDLDGASWINDSKSTNLDAMGKAIATQTKPIVLIAGGKDKGFEFDEIAPLIRKKVKAAVLIGEMKDRIAKSWQGVPCQTAPSLEEAVTLASAIASPGDVVLFLPAHLIRHVPRLHRSRQSFQTIRSIIEQQILDKKDNYHTP